MTCRQNLAGALRLRQPLFHSTERLIISLFRFSEVIVRIKSFALAMLLFLITPGPSLPAFSQNPIPIPRGPSNSGDREDETRIQLERDMAKKANRERQAQLQRDTDNLLKLATELKQYVDKSNENTLSVDVIRKAEEIERLARSVKEKMKAN
jgi:hypothetical protein